VRLIDVANPTRGAFYTNPALYAAAAGGATGFLLLMSALQRGSVTTTVSAMVVGETIAPALVGVVWLGDRAREGLGWVVVVGFLVAVAGTLLLARFGEAPDSAKTGQTATYFRMCPCLGERRSQLPGYRSYRARGASTAGRLLR
jgi:hypothetical protein